MPPTPFGLRLAKARGTRELTQEQLAQKSGVPAAVISHFETGVRASASADNLVKLADALRVSVDYLLGRTDDLSPPPRADDLLSQLSEGQIEILEVIKASLARSKGTPRGKK